MKRQRRIFFMGLLLVVLFVLLFNEPGTMVGARPDRVHTTVRTLQDEYTLGEEILLDVAVSNTTGDSVRDVTVVAELPAGFEHVSGNLTLRLGELRPGASHTIRNALSVRLLEAQEGTPIQPPADVDPLPKTGEEPTSLLLPIILIASGLCLTVYVYKRNQRDVQRIVAVAVASTFLLSAWSSVGEVQAASERESTTFTFSLLVDGEDYEIRFQVSYLREDAPPNSVTPSPIITSTTTTSATTTTDRPSSTPETTTREATELTTSTTSSSSSTSQTVTTESTPATTAVSEPSTSTSTTLTTPETTTTTTQPTSIPSETSVTSTQSTPDPSETSTTSALSTPDPSETSTTAQTTSASTTTITPTSTTTTSTQAPPAIPVYGREITNIPLAGGDRPLPQEEPPVAASVVTPVFNPYYRFDPDPFRLAIMTRIEEELNRGTTEINVSDLLQEKEVSLEEDSDFQDLMTALLFTVKEGNPEYFYYDNSVTSRMQYSEDEEIRTYSSFVYDLTIREEYTSEDARQEQWNELTREANRVAGVIMTRTSNDWQRLRLAHDYLTIKNVYSPDSNVLTNNVVDGLLGSETMCVGYAQAFQMIASRMGYETYNIYGYGFDQAHLWNIVRLNDNWYHVDVTFDDPAGNNYPIPLVSTAFFLRGANAMSYTHEVHSYDVPAAPADYLGYYVDAGRTFSNRDNLTGELSDYISALDFADPSADVYEFIIRGFSLSAEELELIIHEAFESSEANVSISYRFITRNDISSIFFYPPG